MEIVSIEIKRSGYSDALSAGVVLSGGGSLIKNICPLANEILGMDAKIGIPLGITGGLVERSKQSYLCNWCWISSSCITIWHKY